MKMIFTLLVFLMTQVGWADPECEYNFSVSNATLQLAESSQVVQQIATLNRGQNSPDGRENPATGETSFSV